MFIVILSPVQSALALLGCVVVFGVGVYVGHKVATEEAVGAT